MQACYIDHQGSCVGSPVRYELLYVHVVARLPLPAIGVVLTIAMVLTWPLTPLTGALVDRFGARRLVIASHLLQAMGFLGCHFARKTSKVTPALSQRRDHPRLAGHCPARYRRHGRVLRRGDGVHRRHRGSRLNERDRWYGLVGATQNVGLGAGGLLAGLVVGVNGTGGYPVLILTLAPGLFTVLYVMGPALPWLVLVALVLAAGMLVAWLESRLPAPAVRAR